MAPKIRFPSFLAKVGVLGSHISALLIRQASATAAAITHGLKEVLDLSASFGTQYRWLGVVYNSTSTSLRLDCSILLVYRCKF